MPEEMERKLKAEAAKKGLKGKRADRFVYGTMRKTGWKPKGEIARGKPKKGHDRA